ncbi:MAG TPA: EAL domain-containing protein [Rhodocyclaceae bacterium]|nr:EAL domain-containing protein [Rhodocyclaceae bacterium]
MNLQDGAQPPPPDPDRNLVYTERKLKAVWDYSSEAMAFLDGDGFLDCNDAGRVLFGFAGRESFLGQALNEFALDAQPDGRSAAEVIGPNLQKAVERGHARFECLFRRADGSGTGFMADVVVHPIELGGGRVVHAIFRDVTQRWERERDAREARDAAEDRLRRVENFDALTGLPNRESMLRTISEAVTAPGSPRLALLILDIGDFRTINDSLGRETGDRLLIAVARRLRAALAAGDTVARVGGDEFAVLLAGGGASAAERVAARLATELAAPLVVGAHRLAVTPAIGISRFPVDARDADEMLKHADTAMYCAKADGRGGCRMFEPQMTTGAFARLTLEGELRKAVEQKRFELHYQPQVDLDSGRVVGLEALIRWPHPDLGLLPPAHFIPLAEQTGLIVPIGEWVMREACRQIGRWNAAGLPAVRVAINVSARQFRSGDLVDALGHVLADHPVGRGQLEMEFTEGVLMEQTEATVTILSRLREMGVRMSVDDFGTGYSSLAYLRRFPLDALKLDRSFVADIDTDADNQAIARAVISLGHSLRLEIIAEGVETAAQLEVLRAQGCDQAQGYLFARPASAGETSRQLEAWAQGNSAAGIIPGSRGALQGQG